MLWWCCGHRIARLAIERIPFRLLQLGMTGHRAARISVAPPPVAIVFWNRGRRRERVSVGCRPPILGQSCGVSTALRTERVAPAIWWHRRRRWWKIQAGRRRRRRWWRRWRQRFWRGWRWPSRLSVEAGIRCAVDRGASPWSGQLIGVSGRSAAVVRACAHLDRRRGGACHGAGFARLKADHAFARGSADRWMRSGEPAGVK